MSEKGGRFGGTEEYFALITEELSRWGVQSHLVCGAAKSDVPQGLASVEILPGLLDRSAPAGVADELLEIVRRLGPDIVYLHNIFDPEIVHKLAEMQNRPILLWYVHDHYLTCLSELRWRRDLGACRARLGLECLEAMAAHQCVLRFADQRFDTADLNRRIALNSALSEVDAVIVVSQFMRSLLDVREELADRIHLVPRPIRPPRSLRSSDPRRQGAPAIVTFAGRITPEKGLDLLIRALGAVRVDGPVELRVAGVSEDALYQQTCVSLAQRAAQANPLLSVSWLGHLGYSAVDSLLAISDVVAVPSQWPEPLGAIALEAMAAGAVVVASDIGGLGSYLISDRNSVLIHPYDVAGWTAALEIVLNQAEMAARLSAQARADVTGLSARAHVDELATIVERFSDSPIFWGNLAAVDPRGDGGSSW